jgi:signal transduction histidine kinase
MNSESNTISASTANKIDILVVDDTNINLDYLVTVFSKQGWSVKGAEDGETALKIIREEQPVLIILDIMMPKINGYEICHWIKTSEEINSIPIIFISALNDSPAIIKGFAAGAVDYIGKPFNVQEVIARVETHLTLRKLQLKWENNTKKLVSEISERKEAEIKLRNSLEQVRNLAGHLQSVREEERQMVSREIHDDIGQVLTALKIELTMIKNDLNSKAKKSIVESIDTMMNMIDGGVKNVRQLMIKLRPEILDNLSLVEALKWQCEEFNKKEKIECTFTSGVDELHYNNDVSLAIFRILQEALNNVRKHSQATTVSIKLEQTTENAVLTITDNGIGFNEPFGNGLKRFGLISMRERALLFGGKLEIVSGTGKGTNVILTIPAVIG